MTTAIVVGAPRDRHAELVKALEDYAEIIQDKAEARRLAWFLGDRDETEAAEAIMRHAGVREVSWSHFNLYGATP